MRQKYIFILLKNLPPSSTSFFWWKCNRGSWEEATVFTLCFVCQNPLFLRCSLINLYSNIYVYDLNFLPYFRLKKKSTPLQAERQKARKHSCILKLLSGFGSTGARNLQSTLLWRQTAKALSPLPCLDYLLLLCGSNAGSYRRCQLMITTIVSHLSNGISSLFTLSYSFYIFPVPASAMFHEL